MLTFSDRELLQKKDFEQMSAEELAQAKERSRGMRLPICEVPTRRFAADPAGRRVDLRAHTAPALRGGGGAIDLRAGSVAAAAIRRW